MLESTDDYRPVPGDWIAERIDDLLDELSERDRQFESRRPRQFLDPAPIYELVRKREHSAAVAALCGKYGLDPSRVGLQWVEDIRRDRVAAHVSCEQFGAIHVTIRRTYAEDPPGFGTVMAHELGHAYLCDLDIPNGGGWEEEATTDLVTFVVGLGKLTVNGVDHLAHGQQAGSRCYGYLNREANVFAYALIAERYRLSIEQRNQGVNSAVLSYLNTLDSARARGGCLFGWLGAKANRPRKAVDMDLTVDDEGRIVER